MCNPRKPNRKPLLNLGSIMAGSLSHFRRAEKAALAFACVLGIVGAFSIPFMVVLFSLFLELVSRLVAQCSATPAAVAATPPCSATPFQTPISVRHLPGMGGGGKV